jgi:prevent-host-death family protein
MRSVGTAELKARLSEHLRAVQRGETITVLDRQQPVARLVPVLTPTADVVIRPARPGLHEVRLPGPSRRRRQRDVVKDLLAERAER